MEKIYKGIVNNDCAQSAVFYRNKLLEMGFPKEVMKFGIFEIDKESHVVLILDVTQVLFREKWKLKGFKP